MNQNEMCFPRGITNKRITQPLVEPTIPSVTGHGQEIAPISLRFNASTLQRGEALASLHGDDVKRGPNGLIWRDLSDNIRSRRSNAG